MRKLATAPMVIGMGILLIGLLWAIRVVKLARHVLAVLGVLLCDRATDLVTGMRRLMVWAGADVGELDDQR